jgi:hypothetical protein
MKIQTILLPIFLLAASLAFAKEGSSLFDIIKKMRIELQLTNEQVESIKPILKEGFEKRQDYLSGISGEAVVNKKNLRAAMLKLREEENEQLSKFLSKEQMKKLIDKEHLRDSLNKDQIDFSEGLSSGPSIAGEGASLQF